MDETERLLQRIQKLTTADYLPAIYDGFVEAEALVQSEDALLRLISTYIRQMWQNRNLLTMTEDKLAEFEAELHIVPAASQSLDDRRNAVANAVNDHFVMNEAKLHALCQSLAPSFNVYERTDPQTLTLGVFTQEDADDGTLPSIDIVDGIRPVVPLNLAIFAGVETQFSRPLVVSHAQRTALWASLGRVEKAVVPPLIAGLMEGDGMRLYADGTMQRGGILYSKRTMTEAHEVYGDKIEVWHSSYTPHAVVFPDKTGTESAEQMYSGTIRRWGGRANRGTAIEEVAGRWMSTGAVTFAKRTLTENCEVYGERLEVWQSSYTPQSVTFPDKTGIEASSQIMAGTLRKWGNKANRNIDLVTVDGGSMVMGSTEYPDRTFTKNYEVIGEKLKVYNKSYTPVIVEFPDKGSTEPNTQMIGGTVRIKGNKANRGMTLENITGQIMPN